MRSELQECSLRATIIVSVRPLRTVCIEMAMESFPPRCSEEGCSPGDAAANMQAMTGSNSRGMHRFFNVLDWVGGLPYETAAPEDVIAFFGARGFVPTLVEPRGRMMNSKYIFLRASDRVVPDWVLNGSSDADALRQEYEREGLTKKRPEDWTL